MEDIIKKAKKELRKEYKKQKSRKVLDVGILTRSRKQRLGDVQIPFSIIVRFNLDVMYTTPSILQTLEDIYKLKPGDTIKFGYLKHAPFLVKKGIVRKMSIRKVYKVIL